MNIKKHICVIILLQLCLLSFSQDVIVCQGDTFKFNSVSSNTSNFVEWDFVNSPDVEIISGQNTDSLTVKFNETGNYTLQFREYALPECFGYVEQNIEVVSNPLANFSNGAICIYDSIKFFNNSSAIDGIQSSIWRIGDFVYNGLNLTYTFDETGDYVIELSVESNNGCFDKFDMLFKLSDRPKASFYFSPEHPSSLSPIVTFNNTSLNFIDAYWNFGDNNFSNEWDVVHSYDSVGWFEVELFIEDINGCSDSTYQNLLVENDIIFYMPNSFTPDGDGLNDNFVIKGFNLEKYQSYYLEIINRWGEVIYTSDDINSSWDGKTSDGSDAMSGNYIWSLRLKDMLGKEIKEIGNFMLLR